MRLNIKTNLAMLLLMFVVCSANSAFCACSKDESAIVTGAACSITELDQLEKVDYLRVNSQMKSTKERNLRPVKVRQEFSNIEIPGCFWGQCLTKRIFGK